MAMSTPSPRDQMILTAVNLFQRGGYQATSWRKLVQESGAPWGSAHHYFPGGKEQLGVAAVESAARDVAGLIAHAFQEPRSAADGVSALFQTSARLLERSGFRAGCPLATVVLETVPDSEAMTAACQAAFRLWRDRLAGALERGGISASDAEELANEILAIWEGSLILARVAQSSESMRTGARTAAKLVELAAPA